MTTLFSDHHSNPLQAATSDPTNNAYNKAYRAKLPSMILSSDDELGRWTGQDKYHAHVNSVIQPARAANELVDLDMSDDELAHSFHEVVKTFRNPSLSRSQDAFLQFQDVQVDEAHDNFEEQSEEQMVHGAADDDEQQDDELGDYFVEDDDELSIKNKPLSYSSLSPFSSPQSSRPPSPEESKTLYSRPDEEQVEIQSEMDALYKAVPVLKNHYQLIDRLGTGTFSSVYKAIDLLYDEWDNRPWLGNHPSESTAHYQSAGPAYKGRGGRGSTRHSDQVDIDMENGSDADQNVRNVYVAIKRIHTTSAPERVKNELSILETCRACRHVSQIITAFRHYDQVVVVLPYQRNMDFREFYQVLHPESIKCYFRCLFRALRDIHARGIIHRDVKPANFLFDPCTGIGTLCDFGLASRMESDATVSTTGRCWHSAADPKHPHGVVATIGKSERTLIKNSQREARTKSNSAADKVGYPENDRRPVSKANRAGTRGFRAPEVLLKCQAQTGAIDVWSAGIIFLCFLTGKFPIFQSNDDIEALMEIASVLGIKKLERTATLHGRTLATNIPDLTPDGITWQEFVERLNPDIMTPRKYDMRYYPHNCKHRDGNNATDSTFPPPPPTSSPPPSIGAEPSTPTSPVDDTMNVASDKYLNPPSVDRHSRDMRNAFDLLESMLHFESIKRITPRDLLYHPFLAEPGVNPETEGDDAFVPHRPGMGVCRKFHRVDDAVEEMYVEVWRKPEEMLMNRDVEVDLDEGSDSDDHETQSEKAGTVVVEEIDGERWVKDIVFCMPGQGIAIGNRPCEFHRGSHYKFD